MNDGGRCSPSAVTAKMIVSLNPATSITAHTPIVSSRSTRVRTMCSTPAETSRRNGSRAATAGSTKRSSTSVTAESTKLPASTSATAAPPNAAKIPAPASGATSRSPSRSDWRIPFASASSSSGSIAFSIAERAAANRSPPRPYSAATT